ncbi:hypothetical protein F5884DRAFT_758005 [Xylogone sp. PMI_703]|nr:hypothetical protein F5884DRAFT_758005 [Xylogone sp. PMI_703]
MHFRSLLQTSAVLLALNIQQVTSDCTNYRVISNGLDNVSQKPNPQFAILCDRLSCPGKNQCEWSRAGYNFTVRRFLNISIDDPLEEQRLFNLIQDKYTNFGDDGQLAAWSDRPDAESSFNKTLFPDSLAFAQPGTNNTLYWQPFMMTSVGQLSNCTNRSLEGAFISAASAQVEVQSFDDGRSKVAVLGRFVVNSTKLSTTPSASNSPAGAGSPTSTRGAAGAAGTTPGSPTSTHHGGDAARPTATLLPFGVALLGLAALL